MDQMGNSKFKSVVHQECRLENGPLELDRDRLLFPFDVEALVLLAVFSSIPALHIWGLILKAAAVVQRHPLLLTPRRRISPAIRY